MTFDRVNLTIRISIGLMSWLLLVLFHSGIWRNPASQGLCVNPRAQSAPDTKDLKTSALYFSDITQLKFKCSLSSLLPVCYFAHRSYSRLQCCSPSLSVSFVNSFLQSISQSLQTYRQVTPKSIWIIFRHQFYKPQWYPDHFTWKIQ